MVEAPPRRVRIYDPDGHELIAITPEQAKQALARKEVKKVAGKLVVIPQPIRLLTEEEKRKLFLKKQKTGGRRR